MKQWDKIKNEGHSQNNNMLSFHSHFQYPNLSNIKKMLAVKNMIVFIVFKFEISNTLLFEFLSFSWFLFFFAFLLSDQCENILFCICIWTQNYLSLFLFYSSLIKNFSSTRKPFISTFNQFPTNFQNILFSLVLYFRFV